MLHTGIDLVDIRRIKKLLDEGAETFLARICTAKELQALKKEKRLAEKVAAHFALKEAFSKAVGTGIGGHLSFHDVEVSYSDAGQPRVKYLGSHFKKAKDWQTACSISHEGDMLAAVVILEGTVS